MKKKSARSAGGSGKTCCGGVGKSAPKQLRTVKGAYNQSGKAQGSVYGPSGRGPRISK